MIPRTKIEVTPELVTQLVLRRALGATLREMEKEFSMSRTTIMHMLDTPLAKEIDAKVTTKAVSEAVLIAKRKLSKFTDLAMDALEFHLKEKNLEAVKLHLKSLGIDLVDKQEAKQQQAIQVILPNLNKPIKEVPND